MKLFSALLLLLVALIITPSVVKCSMNSRCTGCCPVQCCTRNLTIFRNGFKSCEPRLIGNKNKCERPERPGAFLICGKGLIECGCRDECFALTKGNILTENTACFGQNSAQEVFDRRRRLDGVLMELDNYELDNYGWEEYKHKCNGFPYELRLYVDWHLMLLALPNDEAVAVGCAPLALHSSIKHHNGTWEKQAVVYDKSGLEEFNTMTKDSIELHSHQFSDIAAAYELAEAGGTSTDVVLSNCGDFARSFGAIVGEKLTPAMTMDIAQRLIEKSDGTIVGKIHSSDHVRTLVVGGGGDSSTISDEELVYRLVESRTRELYGR